MPTRSCGRSCSPVLRHPVLTKTWLDSVQNTTWITRTPTAMVRKFSACTQQHDLILVMILSPLCSTFQDTMHGAEAISENENAVEGHNSSPKVCLYCWDDEVIRRVTSCSLNVMLTPPPYTHSTHTHTPHTYTLKSRRRDRSRIGIIWQTMTTQILKVMVSSILSSMTQRVQQVFNFFFSL